MRSSNLFQKIESGESKGYLCALSFPILYYILTKELSRERSIKILEKIRIVFSVSTVDEENIDLSLTSEFKDFEDAVQYYSAVSSKVDYVITRNKKDFLTSKIPVPTPEEFLTLNV